MFCKFCGNKIPETSIFCAFCGKKVDYYKLELEDITEKQLPDKPLEKTDNLFDINQLRILIGIYLGWFLINFIFLIINWNSGDIDYFWPIQSESLFEEYDFSEFLLYTISPLFIYAMLILFGFKKINVQRDKSRYDETYKMDYLAVTYGISLIVIWFILMVILRLVDDPESVRPILLITLLLLRIAATSYIVSQAKKLNRDQTAWGFFAFFIPVLALIIIGFKRKLKLLISESDLKKKNIINYLDSAKESNLLGNKTDAIKYLEKGLKLEKENVTILKFLGQLYYDLNNFLEAKSIFLKLIEKKCFESYSYYLLGEIAFKSHDPLESISYWKLSYEKGNLEAGTKLELFHNYKGIYLLKEKESERKTGMNYLKPKYYIGGILYLDGIMELDNLGKKRPYSIDLYFNPISLLIDLEVGFSTKYVAISYLEIIKINYSKGINDISLDLNDNISIKLRFKKDTPKNRAYFEKLIELHKDFLSTHKY